MVKYCRTCGTELDDDTRYCTNCGNPTDGSYQQQASPQVIYVEKNSHAGRNAVIAVFVVILILLLVSIPVYDMVSHGHSAQYAVYVHSTHLTETVDVEIFVDGKSVAIWEDLKPSSSFHHQYWQTYEFSIFEEKKSVTFSATSYGGLLGNQTDSKTIVVVNGGQHTVDLYV